MSSIITSGSASGTGSMTLLAPVTNSNQTATLPDATGKNGESVGAITILNTVQVTIQRNNLQAQVVSSDLTLLHLSLKATQEQHGVL